MKIIVAVVVYDRMDNVEEWIRCYKMSETKDAELVIIHNKKNEEEAQLCQAICKREQIKYVPRENIGFDIGALQDVCRERLKGFPNQWDYLLWVTDDVIPMWKRFIYGFLSEVQKPNVGVACLEISTEVKRHVRTSGFIISKSIALKLQFPVDPITTKRECYEFEHRGNNTLLRQIEQMGKTCVQVSPTLMVSHLWDTGNEIRLKLNRWNAHYREFPKIATPIYNNIIVAVIVYNRLDNVKNWIRCWNTCNKKNAQLIIIHNYDNVSECVPYKEYCNTNKIKYIARKNIGMDIGAFQDVCKERLPEFPNNWDALFWTTDDVIPMSPNFLNEFVSPLKNNVVLSCYEYSVFVTPHIRTLQFCLTKDLSKKLTFSTNPITKREQCYEFEHVGNNTLFKQIQKLGMSYYQVGRIETSPLWDTGHRITLNRWKEHYDIFKTPRVCIIATAFEKYPQIIPSLICQTYKNWELHIIHDGSSHTVRKYTNAFNDPRIVYSENSQRMGQYGHPLRRQALKDIKNNVYGKDCDYIVITNDDNYLVPTFLEKMLEGFKSNTIATYCSMLYNYIDYKVLDVKLQLGYIDCSAVMVRKDAACTVGWRSMEHSSDWIYFKDIIDKYGIDKWVKIEGSLLVHN